MNFDNNLMIGLLLGAGAAYLYQNHQRKNRHMGMRRRRQGPGVPMDGGQRMMYGPDHPGYASNTGAAPLPAKAPVHHSQQQAPPAPSAPMPDGTEGTLGGERF